MNAEEFIQTKAPQLAFFGHSFFRGQLPLAELEHYIWQTLEEWQQYAFAGDAHTEQESIFWFLMHELHRWPEPVLRGNRYLSSKLIECCDYLSGQGYFPENCIGIRPAINIQSKGSAA
ncbi:hypothetical protein HR45_16375 [Shewanella mangrovi]|uniref:Uncharacterized protein n=1 Tax=Shewanella mangrovi TaxID=1515746 RepID=A0A094LMR0_9GAMM|nr:hypothetical protein [Shewanella mangrovi]KFZ36398.1 hypothetical protein HR45_16375 [Shewanella mangrovi]